MRAAGARRSARAAGSFGTTFLRAICILNLGARASAAGKLPGKFQRNSGGCLLAYSKSPVVVIISARTAWERYFTERYLSGHPRPRRTQLYQRVDGRTPRNIFLERYFHIAWILSLSIVRRASGKTLEHASDLSL